MVLEAADRGDRPNAADGRGLPWPVFDCAHPAARGKRVAARSVPCKSGAQGALGGSVTPSHYPPSGGCIVALTNDAPMTAMHLPERGKWSKGHRV